MTVRAPYNTFSQEFDSFLFAPIGEEGNGMSLSVISALTRLNIDPWGEAARLSKLSKEKAVETLAPIIARLPIGQWTEVDIPAIARRLVDALPRHDVVTQSVATIQIGGKIRSRAVYVGFMVVLAIVYFGLVARQHLPPHTEPAPTATSSTPK